MSAERGELNKFEQVPMSMIKNIDFRNIHGKFQKESKHDVTEIKNTQKLQ